VHLTTRTGARLYEYMLTPIGDVGAESATVVFTFRDLTEQRRAEDALRDREEKNTASWPRTRLT